MTRLIDTMHLGRDRVIGAYDVDGLAPTPPPDIDLENGLTHFGYVEDVRGQLDKTRAWLDEWGPLARDLSTEDFAARVEARMRAETSDEAAA